MTELRAFLAGVILASAAWSAVYAMANAEHARFIYEVVRTRR